MQNGIESGTWGVCTPERPVLQVESACQYYVVLFMLLVKIPGSLKYKAVPLLL